MCFWREMFVSTHTHGAIATEACRNEFVIFASEMSRMNDFESVLVCFYTKILLSLFSFSFFLLLRTSFLSACNLLICHRKITINVLVDFAAVLSMLVRHEVMSSICFSSYTSCMPPL